PSPRRLRRARSNAAGSSGGNLDVGITVQSTATRNTAAPIWNEDFTQSGIPPALLDVTPRRLKSNGRPFARLAPTPMKNDCITKPAVRCDASSLSATNARNGSIEMLIDASRIQRRVAAIQSAVDVGMMKSAIEARIAPVRKYGRRRPSGPH